MIKPDQYKQLIAHVYDGLTSEAVAFKLGVTKGNVSWRLGRVGLTFQIIRQMRRDGLTLEEVQAKATLPTKAKSTKRKPNDVVQRLERIEALLSQLVKDDLPAPAFKQYAANGRSYA